MGKMPGISQAIQIRATDGPIGIRKITGVCVGQWQHSIGLPVANNTGEWWQGVLDRQLPKILPPRAVAPVLLVCFLPMVVVIFLITNAVVLPRAPSPPVVPSPPWAPLPTVVPVLLDPPPLTRCTVLYLTLASSEKN